MIVRYMCLVVITVSKKDDSEIHVPGDYNITVSKRDDSEIHVPGRYNCI